MKASHAHLVTLKEAPADAEIVSQKLMIRAGMIRRIAAGIYTWLPLGLRSLRKVEATGELRLYGADGRQTRVLHQASLAGSVLARSRQGSLDPDQPRTDNDWFNVALTPGGLAVFTDRRGNYQFIGLGQPFDSDPVMDDAQDDADGARPGLVYAAR